MKQLTIGLMMKIMKCTPKKIMTNKQNKEFVEEVSKPLFAVAFGMCVFVVVVDYTFQLIEAIDIIAL